MTWLIVGILYVLFLVFVLALCKAAARGDRDSAYFDYCHRQEAMKRHPSYKERKS